MNPSDERDLERLERRAAWRAEQKERLAEIARRAVVDVGQTLWQAVKNEVRKERLHD